MKNTMSYFKGKVKTLRQEYTEADAVEFIKSKGGKCELCGRKNGDSASFGPTHYIKKKILFKVNIHVHKIISGGDVHKVSICDLCHTSYHLFNRLDSDALFGGKTVGQVARQKPKVRRGYSTR